MSITSVIFYLITYRKRIRFESVQQKAIFKVGAILKYRCYNIRVLLYSEIYFIGVLKICSKMCEKLSSNNFVVR